MAGMAAGERAGKRRSAHSQKMRRLFLPDWPSHRPPSRRRLAALEPGTTGPYLELYPTVRRRIRLCREGDRERHVAGAGCSARLEPATPDAPAPKRARHARKSPAGRARRGRCTWYPSTQTPPRVPNSPRGPGSAGTCALAGSLETLRRRLAAKAAVRADTLPIRHKRCTPRAGANRVAW